MAHLFVESGQLGYGPLVASLHILDAYLQRFPEDRCTLNTHSPMLAGRFSQRLGGQIHIISHPTPNPESVRKRLPRYMSADLLLHVDQLHSARATRSLSMPSVLVSQMGWCRHLQDPPPWEEYAELDRILLSRFLGVWREHPLGQFSTSQRIGPLFTPSQKIRELREPWRFPAPSGLLYIGGLEGQHLSPREQQNREQRYYRIGRQAAREGGLAEYRITQVGQKGFWAPEEMSKVMQRSDHLLATPGLGLLHDHQHHASGRPLQLLPATNLTQFAQHARAWEAGLAHMPPTLGLEVPGASLVEVFQNLTQQLENNPDDRRQVSQLLGQRIRNRESMIDHQRYRHLFGDSGLPAIIDALVEFRPGTARPSSTME